MPVLNNAKNVLLGTQSLSRIKLGATDIWEWSPEALFLSGQQGVWYEPKPEYLFQDAAGTVPVAADGDPVGYMQDLSGNGNHATQATSAARAIYRTDGVLHWLDVDGVDDFFNFPSINLTSGFVSVSWVSASTASGTRAIVSSKTSGYFRNVASLTNVNGSPNTEGINTLGNQAVAAWAEGEVARVVDSTGQFFDDAIAIGLDSARFLLAYDGAPTVPWSGRFSGFIGVSSLPGEPSRNDAISYLAKQAGAAT